MSSSRTVADKPLLQPVSSRLGNLLLLAGPDQIVVYARLLLAAVALAAIYIDPTQPARFADLTYAVLGAYAVYAAILVLLAHGVRIRPGWQLLLHGADVCAFAVLVYLTDGPTSPFLAFFTFAIVSGALHWGAVGAATTAAILLSAFLMVTTLQLNAGEVVEANRVIVRAVYLLVAAAMIGYLGWHRQRSVERLGRLAAWPAPLDEEASDDPPIATSLRHAALVLGVQRLLVIWEDDARGGWRIAHWTGEACEFSDWQDGAAPNIGRTGPLDAELARRFRVSAAVSAPFDAPFFHGTVVIIDPEPSTPDLASLTEIVARHIGVEFEHHRLRLELSDAAVTRDRARLSRDLHDGILQDLAAAGLHLKAMSRRAPAENQAAFEDLIALLMEQQARVREFVTTMNPKPDSNSIQALAGPLNETVDALRRHWQCAIAVQLRPEHPEVTTRRLLQIRLIVGEAVANAVRHGRATEIGIEIEVGESIQIAIQDNGRPPDSIANSTPDSDEPPFFLAQRIREVGGTCRLVKSETGGRLLAVLPRG